MKRLKYGIVALAMIVLLTGCSEEDVADQVANVVQAEDEHVLMVKGGTPNAYPGKEYGEYFEKFFGSPAWKYFVGTKEGSDDDGDGKPDYTEENIDIVEFTGYCTYEDVEVKALIQFTLDEDSNTFETTYLSFNDVPQSNLMLIGLMEAVFTDGEIEDTATEAESVGTEVAVTEEVTEMTEAASAGAEDYPFLQQFIDLINSYSDPPSDMSDAEMEQYYKEQYDIWKSGQGYYLIEADTTGQPILADHSAEYIGQWGDTYSQRCYMKIRCTDGINYYIDINWGSSAWENTHWSFTGTYDSSKKGILYSGSCIQEYYKEDGSVTEEYTYQDGEGLIFFGEDGMLHWDDWKENMGVDCRFEKTGDLTAEYILPESDSRYLTKADLTGLTAKQCRIARNEIYARHGRKFNDIGLQSYFDSCNWYFPSIEPEDFKDSMLNEYEMANKDLILEYEEELGN